MLDPCEAAQENFYQPGFAQLRGSARTYDQVGSWWASQHYRDLNAATGGELDKKQNSAYDLGIDGVELMHSVQHTTTLGFLRCVQLSTLLSCAADGTQAIAGCCLCRCRDLPPHIMSKRRYNNMVLCIPGPKAPPRLDAYLSALGSALARLSEGAAAGARSNIQLTVVPGQRC